MKRIVTFLMAVIMIATLANPSTVDAATNAKLSKTKVTLSITDKKKNPSVTLKVKGTSKKAAKKTKWTTSNKKVVKISKGKITAKKPGKATITCKVGKKKLKCNVTVVDKRKAAKTSEGDGEDEKLYDPCPAGGGTINGYSTGLPSTEPDRTSSQRSLMLRALVPVESSYRKRHIWITGASRWQ